MLARSDALPDLVVLDLHFAVPEERLLPEDKSHLPTEPPPGGASWNSCAAGRACSSWSACAMSTDPAGRPS